MEDFLDNGETGRSLQQRIKEHKKDVHNSNTSYAMFLHIKERVIQLIRIQLG